MAVKALSALVWTTSQENSTLTQAEFLSLCKEGNEGKVLQALRDNPDININCVDSDGYSPLIRASRGGWKEVAALLQKAKGITETINYRDREGKNALIHASEAGHENIVRSLLAVEGIDVNHPDAQGISPLIASIQTGNEQIAGLLISDPRTLVNQPTPQNFIIILNGKGEKVGGYTPLMVAVAYDRIKIVRLFISDPKTKVDLATPQNISAFTVACMLNKEEIAAELLTQEVDVNRSIDNSLTPLMIASTAGYLGIVKMLVNDPKSMVNMNQTGVGKLNALMLATMAGHTECVKLLVNTKRVNLDHIADYGLTALSIALYKSEEIAKVLRNAGATNVNTLTWAVSWATFLQSSALDYLKRFGIMK